MKTLNLIQGSPEWKAHRATACNASDAPAMLGISKYKSRNDLIKERATGIVQDVDAATQRLFNDGHHFEALARPLAEEIIGDELSPITGVDGKYSASFDGITFDGNVIMEHKTANDEIRNALSGTRIANVLSEHYCAQMEHQLMVSGAQRCLFMATTWDKDGNNVEAIHAWYEPDFELRKRIIAGWEQFEKDVAAYVPDEVKEAPKAEAIIALPTLFVHAKGEITTHNMDEFGTALTARLAEVRAIALVSDQDFSNAKEAAKKFRETAKAIALSKEQMLAQTETIGEAARKMDAWAKDLNSTALQLEKDVEREDLAKKRLIVADAAVAFSEHVAALEAEIKPIRMSISQPDFVGEIKGKRNYASMQNAVDTALANGKIAADAHAKDYRAKLDWCKENAAGHGNLFPDLQTIITKQMDDFTLLITSRIEKAKAEEAARMEAERARMEAEATAKAERESAAKLAEETERIRAEERVKAQAEAVALANREQLAAQERTKQKEPEQQDAYDAAAAVMVRKQAEAELNNHQSEAVKQDGARPALVQTEPAAPVRPSRQAILASISSTFGVCEESALEWIIAEFAGDIQFNSRKAA